MGEFWKTLKKEDFEKSKNAVLIWLFYNAGETIAQEFWRKFCKRTIQNLPIPRESIKKYLATSEKTVKENANEIEVIGERTIYRMLNEKLK